MLFNCSSCLRNSLRHIQLGIWIFGRLLVWHVFFYQQHGWCLSLSLFYVVHYSWHCRAQLVVAVTECVDANRSRSARSLHLQGRTKTEEHLRSASEPARLWYDSCFQLAPLSPLTLTAAFSSMKFDQNTDTQQGFASEARFVLCCCPCWLRSADILSSYRIAALLTMSSRYVLCDVGTSERHVPHLTLLDIEQSGGGVWGGRRGMHLQSDMQGLCFAEERCVFRFRTAQAD